MISEVLRVVRIANDMSIKEVSNNSNVSVSYISEIEKNKHNNPSIYTLEKICMAYNLKVSDLLSLDEYHESIIGLKEQLKIYQLLLIKTLDLYNEKEKEFVKKI